MVPIVKLSITLYISVDLFGNIYIALEIVYLGNETKQFFFLSIIYGIGSYENVYFIIEHF